MTAVTAAAARRAGRVLGVAVELVLDPLGVVEDAWRASDDPRRPRHRVHRDAQGNIISRGVGARREPPRDDPR